MTGEELRAAQAPRKQQFKEDPKRAFVTLRAHGELDPSNVACRIAYERPGVSAGLHPLAGGDGSFACSGTMLLEALAGCAGVTLVAVATALGLNLRGGKVSVEGDMDFRGTLGVDRGVPIGFQAIRVHFALETDASESQLETLLKLAERYCVVLQTLKSTPAITLTTQTHW